MADNPHFFQNPLAAMVLLMMAHTPDPVERINTLNNTINSMREAVKQINSGCLLYTSDAADE